MSDAGVLDDKARRENFPVALRLLPARARDRLLALYRFARYVDDLGDEWAGDRERALREVWDDLQRLYDGDRPRLAVVRDLAPLVAECGIPLDPWTRLVEANLQDQKVSRYATFDDLVGYCRLSANPVGELVLHLFGQADADNLALADRVCTGLQLVEHCQDVGEDYRNGRVYLPQEDLRLFGVEEQMLAGPRTPRRVADLVAFELDRAVAWLDSGAFLVPRLHGWARVAVTGYVNGGRAAARVLAGRGFDCLSPAVTPTARQVAASWLGAAVRRPG